MQPGKVLIIVLLLVQAPAALAQRFDTNMVWPLCGRITADPPNGWNENMGCPADRQGNPDFADIPFSSTFGPRLLASGNDRYDFHRGVDIATPIGTPIFAIADGNVEISGDNAGFSDPVIKIRHFRPGFNTCANGVGCYHSYYLHLRENNGENVVVDQWVTKGELIGWSGESGSGFDHLHFEVRDAPGWDRFSSWQRDIIHPFTPLPYQVPNHTTISFNSVNVNNPNNPIPSIRVFGNRYDLVSIELAVFDQNMQEIAQAGNTPNAEGYHIDPSFWDMNTWNFEYSHKDSNSIPWESFDQMGVNECPYHSEHPANYTAHAHMDNQDPGDEQEGLFNGVHIITNKYWLVGGRDYEVNVEFRELTGPAHCMVADAVFSTGVISTARWGNCPTNCSANKDITLNEWNSFSLPCDPGSDNQVQDIFDGLDSGDYGVTWVVLRFDMAINNWAVMTVDETMWPGDGYFIYSTQATTMDYDGWDHNENDYALQAEVTDGRFNFVGSVQDAVLPWPQAIVENQGNEDDILDADPINNAPPPVARECDMDPVGDDCQVSRIMYKWSGGNYDSFNGQTPLLEGEIEPGDALWVKAFRPMSRLRQPVPVMAAPAVHSEKAEATAKGVGQSQKNAKSSEWFIRLVASAGNKQDQGNVMGQLKGSIDGLDSNDLPELRPFGAQYLSLVFNNPDLPEVDWGYTSDFRAPGKKPRGQWPILIRSSSDLSDVTLTWEGDANLFKGARLRDDDSGKTMPLKPGGSYTFPRLEKGNRLTLLFR